MYHSQLQNYQMLLINLTIQLLVLITFIIKFLNIYPDNALKTLLNILNDIWITGKFPKDWSKATIIPIPKPNKDHTEATNYRPIALTSCLW